MRLLVFLQVSQRNFQVFKGTNTPYRDSFGGGEAFAHPLHKTRYAFIMEGFYIWNTLSPLLWIILNYILLKLFISIYGSFFPVPCKKTQIMKLVLKQNGDFHLRKSRFYTHCSLVVQILESTCGCIHPAPPAGNTMLILLLRRQHTGCS